MHATINNFKCKGVAIGEQLLTGHYTYTICITLCMVSWCYSSAFLLVTLIVTFIFTPTSHSPTSLSFPFSSLQASHTCTHILLSTSSPLNNSSIKQLRSTAQLKWCLWLPCVVFFTKGAMQLLCSCLHVCGHVQLIFAPYLMCTILNLSMKQQWLCIIILKHYSRATEWCHLSHKTANKTTIIILLLLFPATVDH